MGIEGYVGKPGSGKTYTLTERVVRAARSGRTVYTNYPVACENVYLFNEHDLLFLPGPALVVIDEAHLWFPARGSLRLPMSWLHGMSQTRKKGWDLLWSTQHENRVDRVIRDITSWQWLCSAWLTYNGHPLIFRAQSWEPEEFRSADKRKRGISTVRLFRQAIADAYNTLGTVDAAQHTASSTDPYAAATPRATRPIRAVS